MSSMTQSNDTLAFDIAVPRPEDLKEWWLFKSSETAFHHAATIGAIPTGSDSVEVFCGAEHITAREARAFAQRLLLAAEIADDSVTDEASP